LKNAKKRVALLGATDRVNYGDLLFPLIIEKFIEEEFNGKFELRNYGIVKSNLWDFGAIPTLSTRNLFSSGFLDHGCILIVVGGEVLGAGWKKILSFISPTFHWMLSKKKINNRISDNFVRILLGGKSKFPFTVPTGINGGNYLVAYNSVGGARNMQVVETLKGDLESSNYISVRDKNAYENCNSSLSAQIELVPDSALIMSSYYSLKYLSGKASEKILKIANNQNYVFFQVGFFKNQNKYSEISLQLEKIALNENLKIVLCPIGIAAGHDDDKALKNIHEILTEKSLTKQVVLIKNPTIWEIMFLIAKAKTYLGTSLHGCITAMSYGVPYIGLNPKISKLRFYLETWGHPLLNQMTSFENIYSSSKFTMSSDFSDLGYFHRKQFEMVIGSLRKILSVA
jgi:hypothetical protein